MKLSSGARVSIKQAIRYQTGLNSGDVMDYYDRHFPDDNWRLIADKASYNCYRSLGYTPNDLITLKKTFIN